jgi:hypothetical protein
MSHPFPPTLWDAIIVFPTWVFYRFTRRWLPKDHFYRRMEKEMNVGHISLSSWTFGSKPLNYQAGFNLWLILICVVFGLWVLVWGFRND